MAAEPIDADGFLAWCRLELGLSPRTQAAYRDSLSALERALAATGTAFAESGPDEVTRWMAHGRDAEGHAPATLVLHLVCWRMYARWLVLEGRLARDRIRLARMPHLWTRVPPVPDADRMEALLTAPEGPLRLRDRCALELLYATGGRASEVAGIRLGDLRDGRRSLLIRGKGGRERFVPLHDRARAMIARYLAELRPILAGAQAGDALLLGARGAPLTRAGLWRIVRDAGRAAGFEQDLHPHLLRHAVATHLIANGADLRIVQELLGHQRLTTTQRYTHLDRRRLVELHRRFHPRA